MRQVGRALWSVGTVAKNTGYFVKAEAGSFDTFPSSPAWRDAAGEGTPRPPLCSPPSAPGCGVSAGAPEARPRTAAPRLARSLLLPPPPPRRRESAKLSERAQEAQKASGRERGRVPEPEPERRGPGRRRAAGRRPGGSHGSRQIPVVRLLKKALTGGPNRRENLDAGRRRWGRSCRSSEGSHGLFSSSFMTPECCSIHDSTGLQPLLATLGNLKISQDRF
ncbi:uncharacterized protein LOC123945625 [Meles meles]|uniref:uncharacterized protein LOC123945468 n=1 Tax=Meles meles TaxID=9662 RepID=UPI001E69D9E9|nr:uncharacterized protein LOC123945468 [Meles meles]XP_045866452.1 uncharacterized protein LOC123945625 [Meles meles]